MPCLIIRVSDETDRLNIISTYKRNENINTSTTKVGGFLNITTKKKNAEINIRCSILCSVGAMDDRYEIFEAADGVFMLYDGESFKVLKEDGI